MATLYLLGIGNLTEPYFWLFILLTSMPFVIVCFLLVRLVAPLSFKDVLDLLFHPIGAGVFTGAAFALVSSAVVALLCWFWRYTPNQIRVLMQWQLNNEEQGIAVVGRVLDDCLKEDSILFTVLAAGFQEAYTRHKTAD